MEALYQVTPPPSGDYSPLTLNLGQAQWAIRSFKPFKSPGPDGIKPDDIQHEALSSFCLPSMTLVLGSFISRGAEEYLGLFLFPKPENRPTLRRVTILHTPLSLCSFLLKILERVHDVHIEVSIDPLLLSSSQHAYTRGYYSGPESGQKASCGAFCCGRAVRSRWGLGPRVMRWIYTVVIEPNLVAGVRRPAAIRITGALSTAPTKTFFAMLN